MFTVDWQCCRVCHGQQMKREEEVGTMRKSKICRDVKSTLAKAAALTSPLIVRPILQHPQHPDKTKLSTGRRSCGHHRFS